MHLPRPPKIFTFLQSPKNNPLELGAGESFIAEASSGVICSFTRSVRRINCLALILCARPRFIRTQNRGLSRLKNLKGTGATYTVIRWYLVDIGIRQFRPGYFARIHNADTDISIS